jgi:site-specific DNA-methyltransferase (adenine-specific)
MNTVNQPTADFALEGEQPSAGVTSIGVGSSALLGSVSATCEDCMALMARYTDKHFDLAIVDPPYGIGFDGDSTLGNNSSAKWKKPAKSERYVKKHWDKSPPPMEYFVELRRVSRKQIIWGGNYFPLPPAGGWIVWAKGTAEGMSLSDAELAWTNAANNVKICELLWSGFRKCEQVERFHPTQKPVKLYKWLLENYAKPGMKILDTHLGSGSHAIACHYAGMYLTACEIDADYFAAAQERIARETRQTTLF